MNKFIIIAIISILTSCSSFFYYPDHRTYFSPEQFNVDYDIVNFESSDGIKLHGIHLKAKNKNPKGLIIQFHGNAQNLSAHMMSLMWLTNVGYDVFTFDYRGYGKSENKPGPQGINNDAIAALKKGEELQLKRNAKKLIAYGQSLGGTIIMRALKDYMPKKIDHLILESTFMSYRDLAINKIKKSFLTYIFFPLAYIIVDNNYSPIEIPKVPLLVIHGDNDPVIPLQYGKEIFEKGHDPKELWIVKGGEHINAYMVELGKYRQKLLEYLTSTP